MNILKRDLIPVTKDFSSLLENFFRGQQLDDASFIDTTTWSPAVDLKEEKDRFLVIADIPGVKKDDINISLENNVLSISGSRKYEKEEKKENYTRIERSQGQFYRRFSLPRTADDAKISAKYKSGVLEISIPKKSTAVEKRIDVKIEE